MKKIFIPLILAFAIITVFNSCSGCAKDMAKDITEIGLSALEGVAEAVDEHGARVGEKTTDAFGSVAEGVGRSLDRQLNEHATKVASVTGRTLVQTMDGFTDGFNAEVATHYDVLPHVENFCSGVSLDYFAKYKTIAVVDAYFVILEKGIYDSKFEFYGTDNKVFLTKNSEIDKTEEVKRKYTLVSFALNSQEEEAVKNVKEVKITVTKRK